MVSQAAQQLTNRNALLFYRDHLVAEQAQRQQSLARKGKSPASAHDDATEHAFEEELAAIDALLQALNSRPVIPRSDSALPQPPPLIDPVPKTRVADDDEPYINPFTGRLVVPETANGPGPSNSKGRNASSEHFNGSNDFTTDQTHNPRVPAPAEVTKGPVSPADAAHRDAGAHMSISSAVNAFPSPAASASASSPKFKIGQKLEIPSTTPNTDYAPKPSFWNVAASAMKSAALLVFRMETTPKASAWNQTSTPFSSPSHAGSNFAFPLQQDASGTWKRLPRPPAASQASLGLSTGSSMSTKQPGSGFSPRFNRATPLQKAESMAVASSNGPQPQSTQCVDSTSPQVKHGRALPNFGTRSHVSNPLRRSWDLLKLQSRNNSDQLLAKSPEAMSSTISTHPAHSPVSNAKRLSLQQPADKHTALPSLFKQQKDPQTDLAIAISVADEADRRELEAVRRIQEQIIREDQMLERQEAVARQLQEELDREHRRFLAAQKTDRQYREKEATARRQQAEEMARQQAREINARRLQAEEDERLRAEEALARRLQREEDERLKAQEALARRLQREEDERVRAQEALARRLQEQYDREYAEQEAYARRLQEQFNRDFERERATLASQEAHARKLQEAWDAEAAPRAEQERNHDPPPGYNSMPPPRPPPSPVSTAIPAAQRAYGSPSPRRSRDWRGTVIWRPPTPPVGTSKDYRRTCYRPPPPLSWSTSLTALTPAPASSVFSQPPTQPPTQPPPQPTPTSPWKPQPPPYPPPPKPCTACLSPTPRTDLTTLPCTHPYCNPCLTAALRSSLAHKPPRPFTCCKPSGPVPPHLASPHLLPALAATYHLTYTEHLDPHPLHCSSPRCATYLPPPGALSTSSTSPPSSPSSYRHNPTALCAKCSTETCTLCRSRAHRGVCRADGAGKQLLALAQKKGWRECGRCGTLVERREGCLHMTCRCGYEFCYACGKRWAAVAGCRGGCPRR